MLRGLLRAVAERGYQRLVKQLVNDIVIGWCHVHGYAHLRLEGQLLMVPEQEHLAQLRVASKRLAQLIRANSSASLSS